MKVGLNAVQASAKSELASLRPGRNAALSPLLDT